MIAESIYIYISPEKEKKTSHGFSYELMSCFPSQPAFSTAQVTPAEASLATKWSFSGRVSSVLPSGFLCHWGGSPTGRSGKVGSLA